MELELELERRWDGCCGCDFVSRRMGRGWVLGLVRVGARGWDWMGGGGGGVGLLGLRGEGRERGVGLVGVGIVLGLLWVVGWRLD